MVARLRNSLLAWVVWSTATSLALATFPRIDCICPDGRTKSFCLNAYFGTAECSLAIPKAAGCRKSSCCQENVTVKQQESRLPKDGTQGLQARQRTGCTKVFVAPEITSATSSQEHAHPPRQADWESLAVDQQTAICLAAITSARSDVFRLLSAHFEVDLTILLQQFRI